ncbi:MAG: hypothetical protein AAF191_08870, partial [Verrucomicrobiota bacterium]
MRNKHTLCTAVSFLFSIGCLVAGPIEKELVIADPEPLIKPTVDLRLRYGYADVMNGVPGTNPAHAGTLRGRLGLLTKEISGFQFFAEYEGTVSADRSSYNSLVHPEGVGESVIADPESHELNQLWLTYKFNEAISTKVG